MSTLVGIAIDEGGFYLHHWLAANIGAIQSDTSQVC